MERTKRHRKCHEVNLDHYFSQILSSFIITYLIFKFLLLLTFYFNRRNIWDNFAIFIFNIFSFLSCMKWLKLLLLISALWSIGTFELELREGSWTVIMKKGLKIYFIHYHNKFIIDMFLLRKVNFVLRSERFIL